MKFTEKISRAIKKIKGKLIVSFILWLVLIIVFVAPFSVSLHEALTATGDQDKWAVFFTAIGTQIVKPFQSVQLVIQGETEGYFWATLWRTTLVYILAVSIGIMRAIPKHEFDGIENGSSDWCENGEQYSVLSNKEGIILAEKNYLPVDKRGNVNVLVVGRFWIW